MNAITLPLIINRRPGRLWAFLQSRPSRLVLAILFVVVPVSLLQLVAKFFGIVNRSPAGVALNLILIPTAVAGYWYYVRYIERRDVTELAPRGAAAELLVGFVVGSLLFFTTMLVLWLLDAWTYTGMVEGSTWIYPLVIAMLVAVAEETLVRGVVFRLLEEWLGSWIALGISAIIFGLMHAFNPGATPISVIAIALEAGVLLGAVYMFSRRLWLVYGLHAAWNFSEGGIFVTRVSGHKVEGLVGVDFHGSDILTGGSFGPEASVIAIVVCLSGAACFLALAKKSGRIVPLARKQRAIASGLSPHFSAGQK